MQNGILDLSSKTREISYMNARQPSNRAICITLFALLSCTCLLGCFPAAHQPLQKTGFYFNTVITVTLSKGGSDALLEEAFHIADRYEDMFSATIASSDISRINQARGKAVSVSEETIALLEKGLQYCALSDGGFDITIGKLSSLWNFSENEGVVPDAAAIAEAVSTVDYRAVVISGHEVRLQNPDAAIDIGGIAKGYIADQMKAYLMEHGVTEGTINLGGNVLCLAPKADGSLYRIGIQKPFDARQATAAVVEVEEKTVVSSGVYERFFYADDTLYHHILDPSTGYPFENNLLSVTVICESSADGDGLSTACFSLGLADGMELIERLPDTEAIFITDDYALHCSSGIGDTIPLEEQ